MSKEPSEPPADERQLGPLGEPLTDAEIKPIRVHRKGASWQVDYGSYVQTYHDSREEAIGAATTAAKREHRELTIEDDERGSDTTAA